MSSAAVFRWGSIWAAGLIIVFLLSSYNPRQSSLSAIFGLGGSDWDILYHLGGNGPWIKKIDGIVAGGIHAPEGCEVEQVHMLSRHGERYPTSNAGGRMLTLLQRIKDSNITLKGDLDFVNDWQYFSLEPSAEHDQLTNTGPYAGTLSSFAAGTRLRTRYLHLLISIPNSRSTNFWASDCNRVIETARYFATGFFGLDWNSTSAKLHVMPETPDLGADTLTPGDTCLKYREDLMTGHDYGLIQLTKFRSTYLPAISARFQAQNPGIKFTNGELYSMQEMCGFEILVRGSSPWCDIFNHDDWLNFEYARDVIHYYRAGPGNRFGPAMGWLWLNATANLLSKGPDAGKLFFSFVHDGDIIPMLAALDLFHSKEHLPVSHRPKIRQWRTSQVVPMNGRIIFERLKCNRASKEKLKDQEKIPKHYVRININDGIVPFPHCTSGPGSSCPLEDFLAIVQRRGREIGDFRKICGLGDDAPARIEFLHQ
ncbi:MAG: hypothetical protein L6R38_003499 [Xanthoria sp. 2 TBL-2021]|nr:MAG: hypothetical protein L6R38_003499 [Xanthoria sp. 2 TBL-2021]